MAGYGTVRTQKALPIGSVQPWGGNLSEIPSGWLLCNGAEIDAAEYPLLARIIRDTYGGTAFDGDFPNYTGTVRLPPTNSKALADISVSYFGTYTDGALVPGEMDSTEALAVVGEFIGDSVPGTEPGDLGPPNIINAKTSLNFTYTPDPQGTIISVQATGTAPTVTTNKIYQYVDGTVQSGQGNGALFTVVINAPVPGVTTDSTYDVIPKDKGQLYEVGDIITISGSEFADDGGVPGTNDITVTVSKTGSSYFEGNITGQKVIPGFSIKEFFVVPRKLGREHMPVHFHDGTYESINKNDSQDVPGTGVGVFANPPVSWQEHFNRVHPCPNNIICFNCCPLNTSLDCTPGNTVGFWIGNSQQEEITFLNNSPFTGGVGRYAVAGIEGTKPVLKHQPLRTNKDAHGVGKDWFNSNDTWSNLRDKTGKTSASFAYPGTGQTTGDADMQQIKNDGKLYVGKRLPFSDSSQPLTSINWDPGNNGSDHQHGLTQTLFDHPAISFLEDGTTSTTIESHDHDGSVNIQYDGSAILVEESIPVLAQPNVVPDQLPDALQITFTTRVASLSVTNLIRAY